MASVKNSHLVHFFYNLPGIRSTYHFLWAWFGAKRRRSPSKKIFVVGVTGTKGKTTTVELINAILEKAGKRTALLSSLRMKVGRAGQKNKLGNSMPGRGYLQRFLASAVGAECEYAIIEVTSQGIAEHRHRFIDWDMGVLTNLAPEHIESHGSFENYRGTKLEFLKYVLEKGGKVFLSWDDEHFPFFEAALSGHLVVSYSKQDDWLKDRLSKVEPPHFARRESAPRFLMSDFNEKNVAAAAAVAKELGVDDKVIEGALAAFEGVPGRMEFLNRGPYTAIVDYAHTPDSLEAAYRAAKPRPNANHPNPRLICVLGAAGGGRDRWKRSEFGKIAAKYCDEIVLADEDPYDEDPAEIVREIRSGILSGGSETQKIHEVLDRHEAVEYAVALMREGDVVIGTGKGSEDWIHIAHGKKIPWDEKGIFEEALARRARSRS